MAITKDFLRDQMKRLEINYGVDKFHVTKEIFELWLEVLADCNEEPFKLAVDRCIKKSEFAPNIAGLMKYYREVCDEHNAFINSLTSSLTIISSIWGEKKSPEAFSALREYMERFPASTRSIELVEFTHKAVSFRNDCRACGRIDIPTITEYIQGKR